MNPLYTIKILKVAALTIELEAKANSEGVVYFWPSLAIRALLAAPQKNLKPFHEFVEEHIDHVDILSTRKGLAQFRIVARDATVSKGFKKGETWTTSVGSTDFPRYVQAIRLDEKLVAAVVDPGSVVPAGAIEVLSFNKKGPGATKLWLNHVGAVGLNAEAQRLVSWGKNAIKIWNSDGSLAAEHAGEVIRAGLWEGRLVRLTPEGLRVEGQADRPGVRAFTVDGTRLWTVNSAHQACMWEGETVLKQFTVAPVIEEGGFRMAASGDQVVISGADYGLYWYRDGKQVQMISEPGFEGDSFGGIAPIQKQPLVWTIQSAALVQKQQLVPVSPVYKLYYCLSAGDFAIGVYQNEVAHVSLWQQDGSLLQQFVLPKASLHCNDKAIRLSPDGAWIVCALAQYEEGGVLLTGTKGQGQVFFPNPNKKYDFITEVVALDSTRFVVGYGNHDAMVWQIDGQAIQSLGQRSYYCVAKAGRLITSYQKTLSLWDTTLKIVDTWQVDAEYGVQWLELSDDGRFALYGANQRSWIRDLSVGESWEVLQTGGINRPGFEGDNSRFFCPSADDKIQNWQVWDAVTRKPILTFKTLGYVYGRAWGENNTFWTAESHRLCQWNLEGKCLQEITLPPFSRPIRPIYAAAFTSDQRLVTITERGAISAWKAPGQGMQNAGAIPPVAFEPEAGIVGSFHQWPASAVYIPRTR